MPRRTKQTTPALKRFPLDTTSHPLLLAIAWLCVLLVAIGALAYLAIDAVMGRHGYGLYLYHQEAEEEAEAFEDYDATSSSSVTELLVPSDNHHDHDHGKYKNNNDEIKIMLRPDFLYRPASPRNFVPPPRVVEFYAPWCPHCQHYAPRYKQLASEVMALHPEIEFHAVSCVAHHALCKDQEVHSYPVVKIFREGSYDKAENATKGVKNDVNSILTSLGYEGTITKNNANPMLSRQEHEKELKKRREKKTTARVVPFRVHDMHDAWHDASLSFEFALKNGIYMENGALPEAKRAAFEEWLELLSKTLPYQMSRTRAIVDAILTDFDEAARGQGSLDGVVTSTARGLRPSAPTRAWRTCTYGDNAMGYTCGLWQLFHVVSSGVVEYNRHNDDPPIPTRHASETLRNYVEHFFQCDVCRMNFLSAYDGCAFDGCNRLSEKPSSREEDWRELPLWLWETHNDVNVRLFGERLEQNHEVAANQWESQQSRWPSLYACPNCWREDRSWDEQEVFKHLHSLYYTGNPTYLKVPPASDGVVAGGGDGSRFMLLRWKVSSIIFVVAALLVRLSTSNKAKSFSGKYKK